MSHTQTVDSPRIPIKPPTPQFEPERVIDFTYTDHGRIIILKPHTPDARKWANEHLPDNASSAFGYSIEHRYFADVIDGIDEAGLTVEAGH